MAPTPRQQLNGFLEKYDPAIAKQAKDALVVLRRRMPGAFELVWDNYNALAIAFAVGERMSDVRFSVALYPGWVSLFFMNTLPLPDPTGRLKGSGKKIRHIKLVDGAATLTEPDVAALIDRALAKMGDSFDAKAKGRIVIRSVSAKQRPRRREKP